MSENHPIKTTCIESDTDLSALRPHWRRLVADADGRRPFCTDDWYQAWRDVFGQGKQHRVFACWQQDHLVALRPMVQNWVWRGPALSAQYDSAPEDVQFLRQKPRFRCLPVRQISSPTTLENANLRDSLISTAGMEMSCQQAWLETLAGMSDWDVARLFCAREHINTLLAQAHRCGLVGFARTRSMPIYTMQIMPWQVLCANRSANFRKQMKRAQAATLTLAGGYRSRAFVGTAQMTEGLSALYTLAESSWKSQGRSEEPIHMPPTAKNRAFFERICTDPDAPFTPYIHLLYDGPRPFSGILTLLMKDRLFGAMTFFDPAYAAASPGRLLFSEAIEKAWQLGARRFDLNGGSPFLAYFADSTTHYHQVLLFNRHPYARMLHSMARRCSNDLLQAEH